MEVLYPRCAGLDVHKDTVVAAAGLAGPDGVVRAVETFATTTPGLIALSAWLDGHGCACVAMEATGVYWRPVWHVLSEDGRTLILANAAHVKTVPGRKTDVADAVWLSDLLAHGLIRASFVPEGLSGNTMPWRGGGRDRRRGGARPRPFPGRGGAAGDDPGCQ